MCTQTSGLPSENDQQFKKFIAPSIENTWDTKRAEAGILGYAEYRSRYSWVCRAQKQVPKPIYGTGILLVMRSETKMAQRIQNLTSFMEMFFGHQRFFICMHSLMIRGFGSACAVVYPVASCFARCFLLLIGQDRDHHPVTLDLNPVTLIFSSGHPGSWNCWAGDPLEVDPGRRKLRNAVYASGTPSSDHCTWNQKVHVNIGTAFFFFWNQT